MLRGYVLCGEPRSGSNLLFEALSSTGTLGYPQDYFNFLGLRNRIWPQYSSRRADQLAAILERGATSNGVYGFKMFARQFDQTSNVNWATKLPNLSFLFLEREDVLGQAISAARATLSGQFRSTGFDRLRKPVVFDENAIHRELLRICTNVARWEHYFAANGIVPLRLEYSAVAADLQTAVEQVASFLGVAGPHLIRPALLTLEVQRDEISDEWREQFLLRADRNTLARMRSEPGGRVLRYWALNHGGWKVLQWNARRRSGR